VVFLCEHGSAKSVIASLYLNKMAKEKGLDWIGISRGLKADPHLQPATQHGLRADGFDAVSLRPQDIDEKDLRSADVVVTIGCALPDRWTSPARHVAWNDVPPVSEDYIAARDAIVEHLHDLLP
jgi:protein-tyrosine-phosphatase